MLYSISTLLLNLKNYGDDWIYGGFSNSSDEVCQNSVTGKAFNRNLTRNSVADAKSPSDFPNFSKFFLISQNPRNSEKNPPTIWVGFFRGADFGGEKTSLNSDVIHNCSPVLK